MERLVGPARVQLKLELGMTIRPGSVVWLHHAGRLLKAAPEQLRGASSREVVEELQGPAVPWTISSLATHPRKTFHDIPTDAQWQMDLPSSGKGPWKIHGFSKGLVSQLKRSGVEVRERGQMMNCYNSNQPRPGRSTVTFNLIASRSHQKIFKLNRTQWVCVGY